jgi:transcription elongation factor GreA
MVDRVPMTARGYEQIKTDLKQLKSVERPKNIKEIEEAIAHGDLSENAEYHAAKERQGHLEARISLLEDRLARAQVIDPSGQTTDQVRFGCTVRLEDAETAEEVRYTIVGEDESDVSQGRISLTSPVGRALMGKAVDDTVEVKVPKGNRKLDVLEILIES